MPDDLIPIQQQGEDLLVDARTLHSFLKVRRDFSSWVRDRLEYVRAVEGEDFLVLEDPQNWGTSHTVKKDYALKLDIAKEFAMLERNEQGQMVRRYFIEKEKELRQLKLSQQPQLPASYLDALKALVASEEQKQALQAENEALKPKALVAEALAGSPQLCSLTMAAKQLGLKPHKFINFLRERSDIYRRAGHAEWVAAQKAIDAGWLDQVRSGPNLEFSQCKVTGKGLVFYGQRLAEAEAS